MSFMHTHPLTFLKEELNLHVRRQIKELYVFLLISSFSWSLITIFEPVFLYKQGFSLALIALYYAIHYTAYTLVLPLGGKFAARFGYERSLAVSTPILIGYFLILAAVPVMPRLLWLAPLVLALHKMFYWPAIHATFSVYGYKHNEGTTLSWQRIISYSMGIAGPFIGGVIIAMLGFSALFIFSAFTLAVAGIPLIYTKENCRFERMSYKTPWQLINAPQRGRLVWSIAGWVEHLVYLVIWPVFLFIILRDPQLLGLVASISVAIMTIGSFYIGRLTDRHGARWVLRRSSFMTTVSYGLRILAVVPIIAVIAEVCGRMANTSIEISYLAQLYNLAKKEAQPLLYVLSFEITLAIFKALAALVLVVIFSVFSPVVGFITAFAIAGVAALLYQEL